MKFDGISYPDIFSENYIIFVMWIFKGLDIGALDVKRAFTGWFWSSTIYTKLWNYVIAPKIPQNSTPGHKNNQAKGSRGGEQREGI